ncbi:MAG TPA: tRNA (5-methylaminomethyl-2-thiouridine)(34)-methyltransferase MnmD [Paludibacter sp.]|nr:tRNA (5-methylaminomethyl-2-thiouridine)(34)-methyltransferase MnmD [Paludibacter sp.]
MNIEIKITSDGSHTLYVPEIDESYHSAHGAIQESRHIFIEAGLKLCQKAEINVLEIGFGTGLNALLALEEAEISQKYIHFTTIEKYPVNYETALQLNYPEQLKSDYRTFFNKIHSCQWNEIAQISQNFTLKKIEIDFLDFEPENFFDVIFFDAFSPEKQAEMWTQSHFEKIYRQCNQGAVLTTYCAKGNVRRAMQNAGFIVERLPGPPGKREILRATKAKT